MALGATATKVTGMMMRETLIVVLIGLAIGIGGAVAATRVIETLLFGLSPVEPLTIAVAALALASVAAVAGYLPARRASQIDPITALRYE